MGVISKDRGDLSKFLSISEHQNEPKLQQVIDTAHHNSSHQLLSCDTHFSQGMIYIDTFKHQSSIGEQTRYQHQTHFNEII